MTEIEHRLRIEGEASRALIANIRDVIGDDDEMALTAIEGETSLLEVIGSAVDRLLDLKAHDQAIGSQMQALAARKSRFEEQAERLKAAIHVAMGQAELRKIELPQVTLSVRAVPPKAEITNEAEIPPRFWKPQDPKLDRKELLEALKSGEAIPGAALSNGGETLSLRTG